MIFQHGWALQGLGRELVALDHSNPRVRTPAVRCSMSVRPEGGLASVPVRRAMPPASFTPRATRPSWARSPKAPELRRAWSSVVLRRAGTEDGWDGTEDGWDGWDDGGGRAGRVVFLFLDPPHKTHQDG